MPELPEVEYTRQNLVKWMQGARIVAVQTSDVRLAKPKPKAFIAGLEGRRIEAIERIGKWLRLTLDDGMKVFAHLGMTGWFELSKPGAEPLRFERIGIDLEKKGKKSRVAYTDSRRWGGMSLLEEDTKTWKGLGPDPLAAGIDLERLEQRLARRKKTSIKEALMDQKVLAGVGNIQAIEALWRAKIDPRSKAGKMTKSDVAEIAKALKWTIARTLADLEAGGGLYSDGGTTSFKIYGKKGTPCPRCKTELKRIELGGRTTTFCPGCQVKK